MTDAIKCWTCGDTGDVHTIDGRWRGECTACDAAEINLMRTQIKRQAAEIEQLRAALQLIVEWDANGLALTEAHIHRAQIALKDAK